MAKVLLVAAIGLFGWAAVTMVDMTTDLYLKRFENNAGDLYARKHLTQARVLARELTAVRIPIVAVLGNHDFESDKSDEVRQILADAGVTVLDGDACEVQGIGIAGARGFCELGSSEKLAPRFCISTPVRGSTTPEPNSQ